ncbi:MAG: efflux RND transporter periplasmic adaptor subunit [Planctomycetes bacterium]|nr:efflux RND transporter periplasmic adaptor subunit [Planctomycetota bacterium]
MARRTPRWLVACLRLALCCVLVGFGCGKQAPPLAPPDAPQVAVQSPAMRTYSPVKEFTGRLITKDPVMVVPQVSGMLIRRAFTDGERVIGATRLFGIVVRPGTLLFEIDKVQFEADLKKAKADIAKAEADIKNSQAQIKLAEAEFARVDQAFKNSVGSKTDLDKAVATVDVSKAQLDLARANREAAIAAEAKATENLHYCSIYAPTSGLVRQAKVAERSIVDAYKTELVEVSPVDPIYALFDVDELTSLWYRGEIYEKKTIPDPRNPTTPLRIWITTKNGRTYPPLDQPGQAVEFIDPEIERRTGTRTIRATFPNPSMILSGGDSILVRASAGAPREALTIPETAVFSQQRKRYVYVAASTPDGDQAQLREIETGDSFGGLVIIEKGLTTADRVIVDNLLRVRPGIKVQIK